MMTLPQIIEELLVLQNEVQQQKHAGDQASERYEYLEAAEQRLGDVITDLETAEEELS